MMDFGSRPDNLTSNFDPIPHGALLWCVTNVRGIKDSKSGGRYLDIELTVKEGQPFERRKVFEIVMDPMFDGNSPEAQNMGYVAIRRILEAGAGAGPQHAERYNISDYSQLSGLEVPVRLKVEKQEGYDPKNRVAEWLTPNPDSSGYAGYKKLVDGDHGIKPEAAKPAAAAPTGFGNQQPASNPTEQAPSWIGPSAESPNPPQQDRPWG